MGVVTQELVNGLFPFVLAILLFSWCSHHAEENNIQPIIGAKLLVGFVAPIGFFYYLFGSFKPKQALLKSGFAILFILAIILAWLVILVTLGSPA